MRLLHHIESCTSTNDEIIHFIHEENNSPVGVYTFNQTQGRGQYGNSWIANPNENIAYSIAVSTLDVKISDSLFNFYTAIIVRNFIAKVTENIVKIKWPNDIILKDKKIGGILIEKKKINENWHFIIGIGINILQNNFGEISKAGSILSQTNKALNLKIFAEEFHQYFSDNILKPKENNILDIFNEHLFRKDQISVFEIDHVRQNGIIKYVDENGKIWIELENGIQSFYHKEIQLLY